MGAHLHGHAKAGRGILADKDREPADVAPRCLDFGISRCLKNVTSSTTAAKGDVEWQLSLHRTRIRGCHCGHVTGPGGASGPRLMTPCRVKPLTRIANNCAVLRRLPASVVMCWSALSDDPIDSALAE